ncbi:MAG: hypothetical protein K5894_08605 [Lachnospiraceae bacterium]|nr:hypothetical protein [Lachnospiraceae bacterium]
MNDSTRSDLIGQLSASVGLAGKLDNAGTKVDGSTRTIYSNGNVFYTYQEIDNARKAMLMDLKGIEDKSTSKMYKIALAVMDDYLKKASESDKIVGME